MTPSNPKQPNSSDALGLDAFRQSPSEKGLPLEQLSAQLREKLARGEDPYASHGDEPAEAELAAAADDSNAHDACEITPRSILEALLFVGSPGGEPVTSSHVASLMSGVRPAEIDGLVRQLNDAYAQRNCPYRIASVGAGYRMTIESRFERLRDKVYGRSRRARLSQAAIEVLALVAYNAPLTADDVSRLRGTPSGPILTHLVRRQLLRVERAADKPRRNQYYTTPRFLQLFGLASLDELPRSAELENA